MIDGIGHAGMSPHMIPYQQPSHFPMTSAQEVFVFSTRLANQAAQAIYTGQADSILSFHRSQAAHRDFLHPEQVSSAFISAFCRGVAHSTIVDSQNVWHGILTSGGCMSSEAEAKLGSLCQSPTGVCHKCHVPCCISQMFCYILSFIPDSHEF